MACLGRFASDCSRAGGVSSGKICEHVSYVRHAEAASVCNQPWVLVGSKAKVQHK